MIQVSNPAQTTSKIAYIDHIKVVLTVLVIVHHTLITYGAPGGWYFSEPTHLIGARLLMTLLVAINQSFFMGLFFFLSALFIPTSYQKKRAALFTKDRLRRLGIPLVFYSFVLSPFLSYLVYRFAKGHPITYWQYLGGFDGWINFGVLWFVAALLFFTLLYVLYQVLTAQTDSSHSRPLPSWRAIAGTAVLVGLLSYIVRIVFPVGWVLKPVGFQLGHFPQYIVLFITGIIASENRWMDQLNIQLGKPMGILAGILILVGFPAFVVVQKLLNFPLSDVDGNGHWPSLWYAVWEQLTGFSILTALLAISKVRWNKPSSFLSTLSRSSFAVYIFHPLVLIALSVALHQWPVEPVLKLLIVAPSAVVGSFLMGWLLVQIPVVNKII